MNGYDVTSQFYDVMAGDQHAGVDAQISAALNGLDCSGGPIVDIGAGTGLTTRAIATTLPDAEILAVEPHPGMRASLLTRIWADADLKRRVSILPMSVFDAPLPATISGAVASAVLVHFDARGREQLWRLLASRLVARGRVVVEIQCPAAVDLPETRMATSRLGRIEYEGYAQATALGESRQRWRMTYRALLDDVEIARQVAEFVCHSVSASQVVDEAARAGFMARISADLVVLERSAQANPT